MATIGVCVFCAVTSVAALFIFIDRKEAKQMKKTVTILLVLCLCIGLCACGGNSDPTEPTKSAEAQKADELILAIGEVSMENESAVLAAKAYYDTLTAEQKAQVENVSVLESAVAELGVLKKEGEYKEIYEKGLEYENNCLIDDAYAEYEKLPSDYEDVAKRMEYLKPFVGVGGHWLHESDTAISNKGTELGTPAQTYYLEITGLDGEGGGTFSYEGVNNHSQYTNSSIFKGVFDLWLLVKNGNTSFDIQYNDDGSYILGSNTAGKTGFGTLTTSFSITADGKLLVEYSVDNNGDITSVVHTYAKPQ